MSEVFQKSKIVFQDDGVRRRYDLLYQCTVSVKRKMLLQRSFLQRLRMNFVEHVTAGQQARVLKRVAGAKQGVA